VNAYARRAVGVTRSLVAVAQSESVTFVAASLAYYAFVSLLPLLLLALVVASAFGGPEVADSLAARAAAVLGPGAGDVVGDALTSAAGRGSTTVFGVVVLLWSALKVFRGMDIAFSQVYGTDGPESLVDQVGAALVVLSAVGAALVLTVAVGAVLALPGLDAVVFGVDLVSVAGSLLLVTALTLTLLPLYYFLPDQEGLRVGNAVPGAVFAAVGWTLLQTGFRVYATRAGSYEAYGLIGGVLLLVTLLYFGGIVLLLGVALNAVLDGRIARQADELGLEEEALEQAVSEDTEPMTEDEATGTAEAPVEELDEAELAAEVAALREELDEKTKNRADMERDLRRYARRQVRRGKARGWGPYLVLLYGTAMTLGAFYFLGDLAAVVAMFVVWTSTLGLYVLMLLVGAGLGVAGLPDRLRDAVQKRR